jgi:hypothetical protein
MERRAVVQADPLAEIGKANAFAIARDLFQNGEGAADRLNAATALAPRVIVVGNASCFIDEPFDRRGWRRRLPCRRRALQLATSSQRSVSRSNRLNACSIIPPRIAEG